MPVISIDGTQLEYVEQGQGDPVVLVHGSLGDYRSWALQMDAFAQAHRVISYSRRYHHPNPCDDTNNDYSAASHSEDLAAFMTGLGLESAHVIGNSYGAYTALLLAARHPERVRALVLGEPPVFPLLDQDPKGSAVKEAFLARVWEPAKEITRSGNTEDGIRAFVDGVVGEGAFDYFPEEVRGLILDNACEFEAEVRSAEYWTPFTQLDAERMETPTLLLAGEKSLPVFRLVVDGLERSLPRSELEVVPESTHEMPADRPDAYNSVVLDFLSNHSQ